MKTTGITLILLVATLALPLGNSFAILISGPPTNLVVQAVSSTQINLSWNAPVNATQNGVNGYKIEQDISCDGSFAVLVANNTSTAFSNTGLHSGTCYAYKVSALNSAGISSPSNVDFDVTFAVPGAPTSLSVTALSATSLKLSWAAPANNGANITGYQIQRNGTILVSNTGNTKLAYTDTGLKSLTSKTYRVAAWNSVGLGPFSANVTGKTLSQNSTSKDNLGQLVSDFVHKRNEVLKKQREDMMNQIQQCRDNANNSTGVAKKQAMEDCRDLMKSLKGKYKDLRKQFKEEFKTFRDNAKSAVKEEKKTESDNKDTKYKENNDDQGDSKQSNSTIQNISDTKEVKGNNGHGNGHGKGHKNGKYHDD